MMTSFEELLAGEYPAHLGDALWKLPDEDKLAAVRDRIVEIDGAPNEQLPFERRILGAIEKDLKAPISRKFILHNRDVFVLIGRIFERLSALERYAPGISDNADAQLEQSRPCRSCSKTFAS